MREILFRGKRIDNGEWVYGCLLNNTYGASKPVIISDSSYTDDNRIVNDDWDFVNPETIGQYTGLTDKNGKKIFENGYLIIDKQTYKVAFNNGEYILTNIFDCDIIQLKNNSSIGVFVDEI